MSESLGKMGSAHRAEPTHIKDLIPDPANRRSHNPRNIGMLVDALGKVGASRSIVVDENDVILAGNGVVEAASEAGLTKVQIVEADGQTLVAVRRRGLTEAQKRDLAIYDNRTAELATWNVEQLAIDQAAGLDMAPFWREEELSRLVGRAATSGHTDPDETPAERATDIKLGDVFALGTHRLICGDCTSSVDVGILLGDEKPRLMVTDPPYGVDYDATWRVEAGVNRNPNKLGKVTNDDRADWTEAWRLFPGVVAYVWHGGLKASTAQESLESCGFTLRAQIIWAKDRLALSRGDYHWQHEPCWYAVKDDASGYRTDDRRQTTVWEIPSTLWRIPAREDGGHGHSTQKPVECMLRPIRNHDVLSVYDPFVGSGTTIIAAEQLARRCFAMELEPTYCQMTIDRWESFTGQKVVKVGEAVRA